MNIITKELPQIPGGESRNTKPLFVLIDYENVLPEDLTCLNQPHMHALLFVGALQKKIPTTLAMQMQTMGHRAQYIQIETTGQNALDMCIAHYTGFVLAGYPSARFLIISKDKGYDPLIQFLSKRGVTIQRSPHLPLSGTIPRHPAAPETSPLKNAAQYVIETLKKQRRCLPSSRDTLTSWTTNLLASGKLAYTAEKIIAELEKKGIITFNGKRIVYSLP